MSRRSKDISTRQRRLQKRTCGRPRHDEPNRRRHGGPWLAEGTPRGHRIRGLCAKARDEHLIPSKAPNSRFFGNFLVIVHFHYDGCNCTARATACSTFSSKLQRHLLLQFHIPTGCCPLVNPTQLVVKSSPSNSAILTEDKPPKNILHSTSPA